MIRPVKSRQLKLPMGSGSALQFEPVSDVTEAAKRYTGGAYQPPPEDLQVNPRVGFAIQQEYRQRQGQPTQEHTRRSYEAMGTETARQYAYMTKPKELGGMGLQHEITPHDPYESPEAMRADVAAGRIKTFATASTGGHEFFTEEQNDQFRATHDVFGHAAIGRGFSRHGEEAAYQSHVQMYPPAAHEALASETRGQNSYLNFSPKGGFPGQGPGSTLVGLSKYAQAKNVSALQRRRDVAPEPRISEPGEQLSLPKIFRRV